jgi:hypothetical protein
MRHPGRRIEPSAEGGRHPYRHDVVHIVGKQFEPLFVSLGIQQIRLVDEESVRH